eukprot:6238031-Amphidinium_carterae.1
MEIPQLSVQHVHHVSCMSRLAWFEPHMALRSERFWVCYEVGSSCLPMKQKQVVNNVWKMIIGGCVKAVKVVQGLLRFVVVPLDLTELQYVYTTLSKS